MNLIIREMLPEDVDRKGYVHWKTWQETYTGLMPSEKMVTLEKCREIAKRWPENTLVAILEGNVIGFACYVPYRGSDLTNCGEVQAIYVLKEAQGYGIGRRLMDAALDKLSNYDPIVLWVLNVNQNAIGFYEHYGFHLDGTSAEISVGTELRMIYHRP